MPSQLLKIQVTKVLPDCLQLIPSDYLKHATLFRKEAGTTMIPYSFDCYCVPLVNLLSKIISPAWGIPRLIPLPILNYLFQNVE